ncbi:MAG: MFS transporter [Isosphaeraceae bacterium]
MALAWVETFSLALPGPSLMSRPDRGPQKKNPAATAEVVLGFDSRVRYQVLGALCSLAVLAYLHRVGFATAAPELKARTGLSDRDLSYLMASFLLAYGVVEIPFGMLVDRFGGRHVLTAAALGWSLLTGAIVVSLWLPAGTVWPLVYLLSLRALFGGFQGGLFPATSRILTDWIPVTERGLAQGCLWTSSRLGGALAPLVVVRLFHHAGIGPLAFWGLASIGFLWCAWFWPWFRNTPETMRGVSPAERERIASGRSAHVTASHTSAPWRKMLGSRSVWCLCLTYGTIGAAGNFFITLLPTYLRTHRHFSAETAGWISTVPLACGVVACVTGGFLSDQIIRRSGSRRWGRRLVGSSGLALASFALISTVWVRDPVPLALLLGLAFIGNDLAMGPSWAACADIGERFAGTLGGTMNMIGSFGGALSAVATGVLLDRGQTTLLFVMLASWYAVGSLCWWGVDVTRSLDEESARR